MDKVGASFPDAFQPERDEAVDFAHLEEEHEEVFREIVRALKAIRYGSIVLTIHEGRLVEITKTVRLRTKHSR